MIVEFIIQYSFEWVLQYDKLFFSRSNGGASGEKAAVIMMMNPN